MIPQNTDELRNLYFDALDAGREADIYYYGDTDVVRFVEVDGVEFENHYFEEELSAWYD